MITAMYGMNTPPPPPPTISPVLPVTLPKRADIATLEELSKEKEEEIQALTMELNIRTASVEVGVTCCREGLPVAPVE